MSAQSLDKKLETVIHVVEFDPVRRVEIASALATLPWPVRTHATPSALLQNLVPSACGCIVANIELTDMTVGQLLDALKPDRHRLALILLCRNIEIADAVAAMRAGVHDVLQLPVVERALSRQVQSAIAKLRPGINIGL